MSVISQFCIWFFPLKLGSFFTVYVTVSAACLWHQSIPPAKRIPWVLCWDVSALISLPLPTDANSAQLFKPFIQLPLDFSGSQASRRHISAVTYPAMCNICSGICTPLFPPSKYDLIRLENWVGFFFWHELVWICVKGVVTHLTLHTLSRLWAHLVFSVRPLWSATSKPRWVGHVFPHCTAVKRWSNTQGLWFWSIAIK